MSGLGVGRGEAVLSAGVALKCGCKPSSPFPAQLLKQRSNFKGRLTVVPAGGGWGVGVWFPSVGFREKMGRNSSSPLPRFDAHQRIYHLLVLTVASGGKPKTNHSQFHWDLHLLMYTIFTDHLRWSVFVICPDCATCQWHKETAPAPDYSFCSQKYKVAFPRAKQSLRKLSPCCSVTSCP